MSSLHAVGGDLTLRWVPALRDVRGLGALAAVGDKLGLSARVFAPHAPQVSDNPLLPGDLGLRGLRSSGFLTITHRERIERLEGFDHESAGAGGAHHARLVRGRRKVGPRARLVLRSRRRICGARRCYTGSSTGTTTGTWVRP